MSSFTELCRMYHMKKNWQERNVYSFGRAYKGCYSTHLWWVLTDKCYRRICRTFYRLINITDDDFETKKIVKRVSKDAKYHFKEYEEHLR